MKKKGKDLLVDFAVKIVKFFEEIQTAYADDGKLSWGEVIGLLPNLMGFIPVITGWQQIKQLWQTYKEDPVLRAELIEAIKGELDIPDDKLEEVIEEGFEMVSQMYDFSLAIKKMKEVN